MLDYSLTTVILLQINIIDIAIIRNSIIERLNASGRNPIESSHSKSFKNNTI